MTQNPFLQSEPEPEPALAESDDSDLYEGICRGGPLAGEKWVSRRSRGSKGFLLVDNAGNRVWIYEWQPDAGEFKVRDELGEDCQTAGPNNRYRAAEEFDYDVIAAPWGGGHDHTGA